MKESLESIMFGSQKRIRSSELENYQNLIYIGKLYMGSNMEPVNINFDTGSYYYFAKVHTCGNCKGGYYDYSDEIGGSFRKDKGSYTEEYADGTRIRGNFVYDTVCASSNPNSCAKDFRWLAITEDGGLGDEEDGIIGLQNHAPKDLRENDDMLLP